MLQVIRSAYYFIEFQGGKPTLAKAQELIKELGKEAVLKMASERGYEATKNYNWTIR